MRDISSTKRVSSRILLDRQLSSHGAMIASRLDESRGQTEREASQFVGKVYDGGAMPQGREVVYLVHPVQISGEEKEGIAADFQVDNDRSIPVVLLGSRQPLVGDMYIVRSIGGRWIAETGLLFPNCNPSTSACTGLRYAINGTVNDSVNGTQPIVYDFTKGAWYSDWLPYSTAFSLSNGQGQIPCVTGSGTSYYYYKITISGASNTPISVNLFQPGQQCRDSTNQWTNAFFRYPLASQNASYPGLLGKPAANLTQGLTSISSGVPASCDPLVFQANWPGASQSFFGVTAAQLPVSGATFRIPKFTPTNYGFTCSTPCPLPQKNLIVTWLRSAGNGSNTLTWNAATSDWTMACNNGLAIRLYATGQLTYGFTVTLRGGTDCSGSTNTFSYPSQIGQSAYTCEPFYLSFNVTGTTSLLYTTGYRSFTVTE